MLDSGHLAYRCNHETILLVLDDIGERGMPAAMHQELPSGLCREVSVLAGLPSLPPTTRQ